MSALPKNTIDFNIPELATKQLKLQNCQAGKKLVISTNFLPLFGFERDVRVVEELIGVGQGLRIRLANKNDVKTKKVYTRTYKSRKNNPLEAVLDIRSQKLINDAFTQDTKTVHIVFRFGEILITPITDSKAATLKSFKANKEPLSAFVACSSGVDAYSLEKQGISIETLLEWRPQEKRDRTNLTETGAINALANVKVKHLINEDIMNLDLDRIAELTSDSIHTLFHWAPQCDDFSNSKAKILKDSSLEDGSTTIDMVIDGLDIIKKFKFPVIQIENVRGFFTSDAGKILKARLKRMGYAVYDAIHDARDFGGLTSRVRYYMVATLLCAPFVVPTAKPRVELDWDRDIQPLLDDGSYFRIPSSTKSLEKGIEAGRARLITPESVSIPTIMKSQQRMAKDSVFLRDREGAIWFPRTKALKHFMGIDENFTLEAIGDTIASEIIGQSVEVPLHEAWSEAVKEHILAAHNLLNSRLF